MNILFGGGQIGYSYSNPRRAADDQDIGTYDWRHSGSDQLFSTVSREDCIGLEGLRFLVAQPPSRGWIL